MAVPQFPKKYNAEVIITPRQHLLAEGEAFAHFDAPKSVIFCFESHIMEHFKNLAHTEHQNFWTGELIYFKDTDKAVALVGNFGIGGPAAAHMMEILIAAGAETFIVIGHAGGLQKSNPIGTIVLNDKAIRDEGVSHHYLKPGKYAYPSAALVDDLKKHLGNKSMDYRTGCSWTIDSMYRETKEEVKHYAEQGVATVEMELASMLAVAAFRKVDMASLLVISDIVAFESWNENFHSKSTQEGILQAIDIAKTCLERFGQQT